MTDQRAPSGDRRSTTGHIPVRMCVGCRERALIGDLLRVVAMGGCLVVDERRRLPGRGAWLHLDPRCLAMAERRKALSRALRVSGGLDAAGVRDYFAEHSRYGSSVSEPE